jgi:hypothetical protein
VALLVGDDLNFRRLAQVDEAVCSVWFPYFEKRHLALLLPCLLLGGLLLRRWSAALHLPGESVISMLNRWKLKTITIPRHCSEELDAIRPANRLRAEAALRWQALGDT